VNRKSPETERISTAMLLRDLGNSDAEPQIALGDILKRFHTRAFGVLTLMVLLPAFLPVPIGVGAIAGPLVSLTGLQMLIGLSAPWLPRAMRQRHIQRATIARFSVRMEGVLRRLERACRPRLVALTSHTAAHVFTGLQLVLLGILLALPIPLTNYPFGLLLLLYAIALIEHDGVLLLIAWILGCTTIVASALLSSEVLVLVQKTLDWASG
jgi:hypothetical protein